MKLSKKVKAGIQSFPVHFWGVTILMIVIGAGLLFQNSFILGSVLLIPGLLLLYLYQLVVSSLPPKR